MGMKLIVPRGRPKCFGVYNDTTPIDLYGLREVTLTPERDVQYADAGRAQGHATGHVFSENWKFKGKLNYLSPSLLEHLFGGTVTADSNYGEYREEGTFDGSGEITLTHPGVHVAAIEVFVEDSDGTFRKLTTPAATPGSPTVEEFEFNTSTKVVSTHTDNATLDVICDYVTSLTTGETIAPDSSHDIPSIKAYIHAKGHLLGSDAEDNFLVEIDRLKLYRPEFGFPENGYGEYEVEGDIFETPFGRSFKIHMPQDTAA